ncbi:dihydroflavonol 4-reductase isoform X2 [Cryptomeria japonica]|uniref:dihydroflavonol 4-reductase isoform X2 n=1 Tax=Cryptomeria japonica TaxID=3369 RepID=UPI0027D9E739|nr:dihydroflavonol 4-reductase isoform X2 [Cryptomeria japonica]
MEGKFCVVGGDGFIGSSLVNSLLNRGFYVHATVLPTSGNEDIHYLQQLPGAHERLKLFNADLRVEGSFDSPISGCQGVYLVASPMDFGSKDPENEVVGVAIQGTINVLKSCVKAKTVKRVVFTSSSCAMSPLNEEGKMNNNPCSVESFWSPVNHFRSNKQQFPIWPYFVSKTLAEQTAWSFAAEHNLDVVTIGPSAVGGPFITPYISSSLHALLFFLPDTLSVEELERFITKRYPDLKIINMSQDVDISFLINTHFESEKLKDLGFTFKHGIEDIYNDCIESYKKLGLLTSQ